MSLPRASFSAVAVAAAVAATIAVSVSLTGCAAASAPAPAPSASVGANVIAPVVMSANALQGATVYLVIGQVLDVDTGDLAVDSYTADVANGSIVEFDQGRVESSATFNPGFTAIAPGSTKVVMTNAQGGIPPLSFTIQVSARK